MKDCEGLSLHGVPPGYFVELFENKEEIRRADVCNVWDFEIMPILTKLADEESVIHYLTNAFDSKRFRISEQASQGATS